MEREILPGTGRGTAQRWRGGSTSDALAEGPLRQSFGLPPPRAGEDFGGAALLVAGFAGAVLGWSADMFWGATPAELGVVVRALTEAGGGGEAVAPPDAATLDRLREAYPDG